MSADSIASKLKSLLDITEKFLDESKQELDKYQIALTGTLRLLDGKSSTIATLQGNKEDLMSYIIQQTTEIKEKSEKRLQSIFEQLSVLMSLVKDDDRNS